MLFNLTRGGLGDYMNKEYKFNIITEGLKNGISVTCRKYNISRTIYYRWLNRYKANGLEGLADIKKDFVPSNKTSDVIEAKLFKLIKTYPKYGPKAIKYLLEEIGINISESAVYNVMKRHNLSNKESRLKFARKKELDNQQQLQPIEKLGSGECWITWVTNYGHFEGIGTIYEYTFIDVISHIACTRLYDSISYENFEDLLTAVAIPVAKSLNFNTCNMCFFNESPLLKSAKNKYRTRLTKTTHDSGFDIVIQELDDYIDLDRLQKLKEDYTNGCISHLVPLIKNGTTLKVLKLQLQQHIRTYNISEKIMFSGESYSPVEYHSKLTNSKPILPLWAYIDREY